MRVIGTPHHVFNTDHLEQHGSNAIVLKSSTALTSPVLARFHAESWDAIAEVVLVFVVHAIQDVRDPADAAFTQHDAQRWITLERAAIDQRGEYRRNVQLKARG